MEENPSMRQTIVRFFSLIEIILPWAALLLITSVLLALFIGVPYIGLGISGTNIVNTVFFSPQINDSLQVGDKLLRFGNVSFESVQNDLSASFFNDIRPGDVVDVLVERGGEQINLRYQIPKQTRDEFFFRLNSQWFVSYIFWLAGTVSLLFLRPRNTQRLLLGLFCYLTAIWLSFSTLSAYRFGYGALAMRAAIWLSVPVYWHLHYLFPTPLRQPPRWMWTTIYLVCSVLAAASWLQMVPQSFLYVGSFMMLGGSVLLLAAHLIWQPSERRAFWGMAIALSIALLPALVIGLMGSLGFTIPSGSIAVLGFAALPGYYFFILFRRQLTMEQAGRADRLVRIYFSAVFVSLFLSAIFAVIYDKLYIFGHFTRFSLIVMITLIIILIINFIPFLSLPALANEHITQVGDKNLGFSANRTAVIVFFLLLLSLLEILIVSFLGNIFKSPDAAILITFIAVLSSGIITFTCYLPFRRFFETKILGMPLAAERLVTAYTQRITTSLELPVLKRMLLDEVMPSLLVRQFALLRFENDRLSPLITLRVTADMLPPDNVETQLAAATGMLIKPTQKNQNESLPSWIRLILPMDISNERRGYWLMGQRDPDDGYPSSVIESLQTLAEQTALALVNIEQSEALRALYFADIDRHEIERAHLAAELHDDVLNELAVFYNSLDETLPAAMNAYHNVTYHLRGIINGLRPVMLHYGLFTGLEAMVEEINERSSGEPSIIIEIPQSEQRYDERVELYLFRIVQQACQNAIQHADCKTIYISGNMGTDWVDIQIRDDGKGFSVDEQIDLPTLLTKKHFGLAGMYERAALIAAVLHVHSHPGQGSQISVHWRKI